MRIFFAGPLTNLVDPAATKDLYVKMSYVAEEHGCEWFWAFLNGTDPVLNPDVPSEIVFKTDLGELARSDVMIAYVGEPTTGTGQEIEFAREHGIPVYLMYEKAKEPLISRMVLGSDNVKGVIEYEDNPDALEQLGRLIETLTQVAPAGSPSDRPEPQTRVVSAE